MKSRLRGRASPAGAQPASLRNGGTQPSLFCLMRLWENFGREGVVILLEECPFGLETMFSF